MSFLEDAIDDVGSAFVAVADVGETVFVDYLTPIGLVVHPSKVASEWADAIDAVEDIARDIREHYKDILKYASMALQAASGIASFIPGIGTAAGAVLNVAAAVAAGKDLTDIAISAVAGVVPGGAIAQMAFDAGAATVKGIANGEPIDAIALDAARGAVKDIPGVGPEALAVFDMTVAVAQGKDLQEAGFHVVIDLVPGGDLGQQAVEFSDRAIRAAREGKAIEQYLQDEVVADIKRNLPALSKMAGKALDEVTESLPELVTDKTRELMGRISDNPDLLHGNAADWAELLGVPEPIARTARALIAVEQVADSVLPGLSLNQRRYDEMIGKLTPARDKEAVTASNAILQSGRTARGVGVQAALEYTRAASVTKTSNVARLSMANPFSLARTEKDLASKPATAATATAPKPARRSPPLSFASLMVLAVLVGAVGAFVLPGGKA